MDSLVVKSTSFSRAQDYAKCPYMFQLKHLEKVPDPAPELPEGEEHPMDRGSRIHKLCEDYVQNPLLKPAHELRHHLPLLNALRKGYERGKVDLEIGIAFDSDWAVCAGDDFENARYRMIIDVAVTVSDDRIFILDWKGLALDTEIATPNGFVTMGEIQVGDTVFDKNGAHCKVTGKSQVKHLPCYELVFKDRTKVVCDAEHLWMLHNGDVVDVQELAARFQQGKSIALPVPDALNLHRKKLPIHPYVLGLWLADGTHSSSKVSNPENFIWQKVQSLGYAVNTHTKVHKNKCPTYTVQGIRGALRKLGLLNCGRNKFIPDVYMNGSVKQRLDLLQGLMDGDGDANHTRKQAVYTTTVEHLAEQIKTLANSLGQQAYVSPHKSTGFEKKTQAYYVSFRPRNINPFSLPRKVKGVDSWGEGHSSYRKLRDVRVVDSVPTQCIAVDSPSHTYLCTRALIPTHNTGKKKNNEIKHHEQLMEYAIGVSLANSDIQIFDVAVGYLDLPPGENIMKRTFTRSEVLRAFPTMKAKHERILSTTIFPATPSHFACRYCPYKAGIVGRGKRAYPGTGHCRRNVC